MTDGCCFYNFLVYLNIVETGETKCKTDSAMVVVMRAMVLPISYTLDGSWENDDNEEKVGCGNEVHLAYK